MAQKCVVLSRRVVKSEDTPLHVRSEHVRSEEVRSEYQWMSISIC